MGDLCLFVTLRTMTLLTLHAFPAGEIIEDILARHLKVFHRGDALLLNLHQLERQLDCLFIPLGVITY